MTLTASDDHTPQDRQSGSLLSGKKPDAVETAEDGTGAPESGPKVPLSRRSAKGAIAAAFLLGLCIPSIAWFVANRTNSDLGLPVGKSAESEIIDRREVVQSLQERLDAQSQTIAPPAARLLMEGNLRPASAIHGATGHVELWQQPGGQQVLRLDGLAVTGNLELVVRLVQSGRFENSDDMFGTEWEELGRLEAKSSQEFPVDSMTPIDQPLFAVIWNVPYGLEFGTARLQPVAGQVQAIMPSDQGAETQTSRP